MTARGTGWVLSQAGLYFSSYMPAGVRGAVLSHEGYGGGEKGLKERERVCESKAR